MKSYLLLSYFLLLTVSSTYSFNPKASFPLTITQNDPEIIQSPPTQPLPLDQVPISDFLQIPPNADPALEYRRQFVINMTKEAWFAYVNYAWTQPELRPLSPNVTTFVSNGNGRSIFAAMSTLYLMGLYEEFANASDWVDNGMNTSQIVENQLWEVPGALLSLYALTGNGFFLQKARHVADRFVVSDNNLWGYTQIWLNRRLEYRYLSDLTDTTKYMKQHQKLEKILNDSDDHRGKLHQSAGNSLMLLVKSYYQTNGVASKSLKGKYFDIIESLERSGFFTSAPEQGLVYVKHSEARPFMYSWHCLLGSMLALGGEILPEVLKDRTGWTTLDQIRHQKLLIKAEHYFDLARNLTETCHLVANSTATGLPFGQFKINPNAAKENRKLVIGAGGYWLWSHLAESYFILFRMTRDPKYQQWAWELAQAIAKHAKVPESGGFAAIQKVDHLPVEKYLDSQPTEFLSGTLKYLYLTFAPVDFVPLSQWVFNAAGHPLPICGRNPAYPSGVCGNRT